MKKLSQALWIIWLSCIVPVITTAQNDTNFVTFFVTITNSSYVPSVQDIPGTNQGVTVSFSDATLNSTASGYMFRQFHLAFPNSNDEGLQNVYLVEVNDVQFMNDLVDFDNTIFVDADVVLFKKYYIEITDPNYIPNYQFQNFVSTLFFSQSALNDIAADYSFNDFRHAFPNSTDPALQNVYLIGVNSGNFLTSLSNYNGAVFAATSPVQSKKFAIYVTDDSYAPTFAMTFNYQTIVSFNHTAVQSIANNYSIFRFQKMFPGSELEHLRQVYFVECNDLQFMDDLIAYNSTIFPRGYEEFDISPLFTPNDYSAPNLFSNTADNHQKYLDLIGAEDAWNFTHGDPTVKIGICDWYVDIDHPEIERPTVSGQPNPNSKVYDIFSNNKSQFYIDPNTGTYDPTYYNHGTAIFGTVAGATNKSLIRGMSSIGFDLKAAIYSHQDAATAHEHVRELSQKGYRAVNCSWAYQLPIRAANADKSTNDFYINPLWEDLYNEVYENGAVPVFAAGNGGPSITVGGYTYDNSSFKYPASLNHIISVTSVGSNVTQANATIGSMSIIDEHDRQRTSTADPANPLNHHHNTQVDICAPGYTVHILDYHRSDPTKRYKANQTGTSLAAPLVTGTIGLMLSLENKGCLSPYQIECLLKRSAESSIYSLPANQKYDNPKVLGAGRLDAANAMSLTTDFDCNDPETKTMYIEEIRLSNKCWTGDPATSDIQLFPVIRYGNGDYEYRWQYISNSTVMLDNQYIANPKVTGSFPASGQPHILYLLLIVKEKNKEIPQAASKRIKVILKTSGWDLAIKDAYEDDFNEPNDMDIVNSKHWNYWNSPWIWNTFGTNDPNLPHQDPEFSATTHNYLHVRVKNVGCSQSPAGEVELKTYWTIASTGEKWPGDWTTNNMQGTSTTVPTGREIISSSSPIYVNALNKGAEQIISIEWDPINPADYVNDNDVATCILARLVEHNTSNPTNGMDEKTAPIQGHFKYNVRQNNNIATRNLAVTDYTSNKPGSIHRLLFSNPQNSTQTFSLQMLNIKDVHRSLSGDLSQYMYGVLHLGDLFDVWVDGGSQGNVVEMDENSKTIIYDPSVPLHLDNIELESYEKYPIDVELVLRDNVEVPNGLTDAMLHLRQTQMIIPPNEEIAVEEIVGAVSFAIAIDTIVDTSGQNKPGKPTNAQVLTSTEQHVKVYPNPAKDYVIFEYNVPENNTMLKLSISNIAGQEIQSIPLWESNKGHVRWITGDNPPGVYLYKLYSGNTAIDVGRIVIAR